MVPSPYDIIARVSAKTHRPHEMSCTLSPTLPTVSKHLAMPESFGLVVKAPNYILTSTAPSLIHWRTPAIVKTVLLINLTLN
jgi:hypothetical protein